MVKEKIKLAHSFINKGLIELTDSLDNGESIELQLSLDTLILENNVETLGVKVSIHKNCKLYTQSDIVGWVPNLGQSCPICWHQRSVNTVSCFNCGTTEFPVNGGLATRIKKRIEEGITPISFIRKIELDNIYIEVWLPDII